MSEIEHISQRGAAPVMRSVMTVPVIVPRFVEKAPSAGADVICLDLEDSVPPTEKVSARPQARKAIEALSPGLLRQAQDRLSPAGAPHPPPTSAGEGRAFQLWIRVNGFWTGMLEDDLAEVVRPGLEGVVLSKTESVDEIEWADELLTTLEKKHGIEAGTVALAPLVETAKGIMWAREICPASPRVVAAIFGAEDYATDIGVKRTAAGEEIWWARSALAVAAHSAGIVPIDTPDPDYTDEAHLRREMEVAKGMGYRGKLVIHPTQVAIANEVFRPGEEEITEARTIVEAFEREGLAQGRAAIPLNGKMVDTPIYWRAKRLLEWAESGK